MANNLKRVLIDTDAIYALAVEPDANHKKAILLAKKLKNSQIYLSDFVLGEAATLLSRRVGKVAADNFLKESENRFSLSIATGKIIDTAKEFFLRQTIRETSFVDCVNIATAKDLKFNAIFSFDKVYERNGIGGI